MENIEFTAIIPVFNGGRFIGRAIESVLSQTRKPGQVVVVDDGSTDNTATVVLQYASDGVEYIYKDNGGTATARNAGIAAARGHYLGFLDADDEWKENLVSDVKEIFEEHPELIWATAPYVKLFENGDLEFVNSVSSDLSRGGVIENYFEAQAQFQFSISSDMFVKREVFDRIGGFDTSNSQYGEDLDMWFRIALVDPRIGYSNRIGAIYWGREGSLMDSYPGDIERRLARIQKTESHALFHGRAAVRQSEPVVLDWIWAQTKDAAAQGNREALEHISRFYGRRLPMLRRLALDLVRFLPFGSLWSAARWLVMRRR